MKSIKIKSVKLSQLAKIFYSIAVMGLISILAYFSWLNFSLINSINTAEPAEISIAVSDARLDENKLEKSLKDLELFRAQKTELTLLKLLN
jgi:preprotein translocase subunit SecF